MKSHQDAYTVELHQNLVSAVCNEELSTSTVRHCIWLLTLLPPDYSYPMLHDSFQSIVPVRARESLWVYQAGAHSLFQAVGAPEESLQGFRNMSVRTPVEHHDLVLDYLWCDASRVLLAAHLQKMHLLDTSLGSVGSSTFGDLLTIVYPMRFVATLWEITSSGLESNNVTITLLYTYFGFILVTVIIPSRRRIPCLHELGEPNWWCNILVKNEGKKSKPRPRLYGTWRRLFLILSLSGPFIRRYTNLLRNTSTGQDSSKSISHLSLGSFSAWYI